MFRFPGVSAALSCLALVGQVSGAASASCPSGACPSSESFDLIQVDASIAPKKSSNKVSNAPTGALDPVPSEHLLTQLEKHCLKPFAKPLHAVGVDILGDTKYLDDADLEDVGLKLVHRRKIRATGKASEEEADDTNATSLQTVCQLAETSDEQILAHLKVSFKDVGLENFTEAFYKLGVILAADTAVLSDTELDTVGLALVQKRRLRDTIPYEQRLPTRDPNNQPTLEALGLGDLAKKLVTYGVRNLQDIEYLDDTEMANVGLLLVHRRKVRAADAISTAKTASSSASSSDSTATLLHKHSRQSIRDTHHISTPEDSRHLPHDSAAVEDIFPPHPAQAATKLFMNGDIDEEELLSLLREARRSPGNR